MPANYSSQRSNQPVPPTKPLVRELANETGVDEQHDEHFDVKPILEALEMDPDDITALNDLIAGEDAANLVEEILPTDNDTKQIGALVNEQLEDVKVNINNLPTEEGDTLGLSTANGLSKQNVRANVAGQERGITKKESEQPTESNVIIGAGQESGASNNDSDQLNKHESASSTIETPVKITEIIDDDIEITFVKGQVLLPAIQSTPMIPKLNDVLSGNMPYQAILDRLNVSIAKRTISLFLFIVLHFLQSNVSCFNHQNETERHYKVEVGDGFVFVKLKKALVDFLIRLNKERREDSTVDKAFVKGLVIAVFSVQKVKSGETFNSALINFIKGWYFKTPLFEKSI